MLDRSGWESQLLETGFLGIFLCPLWTLSRVPSYTPPSTIVIWGFRWLIFRIMLGAGLIKIRGDRCWRELTCMDYHYETQPVPNPIAYFMHRSPWWFHQFETLFNHFIELVVPFFIFLGRRMCIVHGILQILFQVLLIISGNLSFLNWLTIVPSIACFDDASLAFLFSSRQGGVKDQLVQMQVKQAAGEQLPLRYGCYIRKVVNISFGLLIAYLSVPVVLNLLNSRQVMNTSFNPLRIVNTYGAFGSVTKERTEVVIQGTSSMDPNDPAAVWEEYDFKCKPGDLKRRPCFISPYHYRLDWLMWFAAFQTYEQNEWIIHLAGKLLAQEEAALSLMETNPFAGRAPPRPCSKLAASRAVQPGDEDSSGPLSTTLSVRSAFVRVRRGMLQAAGKKGDAVQKQHRSVSQARERRCFPRRLDAAASAARRGSGAGDGAGRAEESGPSPLREPTGIALGKAKRSGSPAVGITAAGSSSGRDVLLPASVGCC
ncbi:lipase maturation factor 1 isoform X3 [Struthio camelus]|uniref:lipase maturation factor 1 isoform X3 n=1 Tax=Struthio camelus TaxID=8801 RepID=UPI003603F82C